jgi:hypothetical protein
MAVSSGADVGNIFSGSGVDPVSAMLGGQMFGDKSDGSSNFVMGALLGRLLFNNGNGFDGNGNPTVQTAVDSAVAAALANANQANNNSMLLLKDIQDSSQEVISVVNSSAQTGLIQQLQNQIATLQGQGDIKNTITAGVGTLNNEIHESEQSISNQLNTVNTNLLQGFNNVTREITNDGDKTRALITQNMITELNNQIADLRTARTVSDSGVNVTNNINQNQLQQQQQQQIWNINNLLQDVLAQQKITQGIVNLGTMTGSAGSQTAANTRVNS